MAKEKCYTEPNAWDSAFDLSLPFPCDPGARFFVDALRALGCRTSFSCEGHPQGFYVVFASSYKLAREIAGAGFFRVEIEGEGSWSIRLGDHVRTEIHRVNALRWAAEAWERCLFNREKAA